MSDDKKDIVTRLRGLANEGGFVAKLKLVEAADEIERLQADNERLRELVEAGKDDRKAIDELVDENKQQKDDIEQLHKEIMRSSMVSASIVAEVMKELGDD